MAEKPRASQGRGRNEPDTKTPDQDRQATRIRYGAPLVKKICERLALGESVFKLSDGDGMPACSTIYNWQKRYPDFAEKVAQAREQGADYLAGRALEVAAGSTKDTVQQDRLFVNTLMKHAALQAPRTWGGKGAAKAADKPQQVEVIFRVRHFEKAIGPDGKAFVREIPAEDEA